MSNGIKSRFVIPKCQQDIIDFLNANEGSRFHVVMDMGVYTNVWVRHRPNTHHLGFRKYRAKNWFHGTHTERVLWMTISDQTLPSEFMYGDFLPQ